MRKLLISVCVLVCSSILYGQDQIIVNDSVRIDCKIIDVKYNRIKYENHRNLRIETIFADTIKGFIYNGKTYTNSTNKEIKLFESTQETNTNMNFYRLSFLFPGISVERKLNNSLSANAEFGTGYEQGFITRKCYNEIHIFHSVPLNMDPFMNTYKGEYVALHPYLKLELRQFYNMKRRQNRNKSIRNNSADYFSLYSLLYFDDLRYIGPSWGFQRNKKRFYFNLNLGAGLYFWESDVRFDGLIDFRLGILLNKGK